MDFARSAFLAIVLLIASLGSAMAFNPPDEISPSSAVKQAIERPAAPLQGIGAHGRMTEVRAPFPQTNPIADPTASITYGAPYFYGAWYPVTGSPCTSGPPYPYFLDGPSESTVSDAAADFYNSFIGCTPASTVCTFTLTASDPNYPNDPSIAGYIVLGNGCSGGEDIFATGHATNIGNGGVDNGGESDQTDESAPYVGDPVNASTGNKFVAEDDYLDNPWLTFRRFYNSSPSPAVPIAEMGNQWRHSFDRSLILMGTPVAEIIMIRPDGSEETFVKANGVWTSPLAKVDQLTETDNGQGIATLYTVFMGATKHNEAYDTTGKLLSITGEDGQGATLTYSTSSTPTSVAPEPGLLITVTDPNNRQLTFTYNNFNFVQQVTLPDGGTLNYTYNNGSLTMASVEYPDTTTRQYAYDEQPLTDNANLPYAMTAIIDESGNRYADTTYDDTGRAVSSYFTGGDEGTGVELTKLTYNSNGTTTVNYPLGGSATFGFTQVNALNHVGSISQVCSPDCAQRWKTRSYDTNGYPASRTDFNNNVTTTKYDAYGLLDVEVDGSGSPTQRTITIVWNDTFRKPSTRQIQDAKNNLVAKTAWVYNSLGETTARCEIDPAVAAAASYTCVTTGTPPAGVRRWVYTYCTVVNTTQCPLVGLLLSVDGPRTDVTDVTNYSYYMADSASYRHGDLKSVTDALGHVINYLTYDGAGRVLTMSDANGVVTTSTYTPRGWLATRSVGSAMTKLTYWPYGTVKTITDPDGVTTTFSYDVDHRLDVITDTQGNSIHYTLDLSGNKIGEQILTAVGSTVKSWHKQLNTLGQVEEVVDGVSSTILNAGYSDSYDANGNLTHTSDALGFQRESTFDALNRLISTIDNYKGTDTATANTTTTVQNDALNRVVNVDDPTGLNTVSTYDGLSNRTALSSPDTGSSTDTFDAAGNRLIHTDAKKLVSTSTYDALNRLAGVTYADTTLNVSYKYDEANATTGCSASMPIGRLTRVVESTVTTTYCYDGRGNITQKKQVTSAHTDTTLYTYTSANRLSEESTPDHTAIVYAYDRTGRVSGVTVTPAGNSTAPASVVSAITWLPFGPINSYTLGNGQTVNRTYDGNYRLTDITSPGFTLHLARDLMENVSFIGNTAGATPATENYSYDPLYRLSAVTDAGKLLESYTYNQTGDRLSKTTTGLEGGAYLYTTGTHQISKIGTNTRANDANGNTTASMVGGENTYGFSYNGRNRESLAQLNGVTVGTYTYNAMGQRISKVAASTERYSYDEANKLVGEYGTTNRDYVWVGDLPVAVIDNVINGSVTTSTVNYITADQLNTPRAVTNSAGTIIWSWAYKGNPFGEQAPTSSTGYVLNLRFPGQYYDAETATNYNLFRNYEPAIGRYQQSDPLGLAGGMSTYAYVGGNPLSHVDPMGLINLIPIQVSGSAILGNLGGSASVGIYITLPTGGNNLDIGVYNSIGPAVAGGNGELSYQFGAVGGNEQDLNGISYNAEADFAPLGGTMVFDSDWNPVGGMFGPTEGYGVGSSAQDTQAFGLNDLGNWLAGVVYNYFHPYKPNCSN